MSDTVAVIVPAYRAEAEIGQALGSLLAQTHGDWLAYVVADDGADYEGLLARQGLRDPRFRFLSTGRIGGGASNARNLALDVIEAPYVAILDADDRMKPGKLSQVVAALADHAVVTTALDVMDHQYRRLRLVGARPDGPVAIADHKFVNFSMDSMVAWHRKRTDARYDPTLSNMTDLELLMQLFRRPPGSFHLGTPLHDYVKRASSMSNGPNVTAGMIASKTTLLQRLGDGYYPMADPDGPVGIARFLEISLRAEAAYPAALKARPGLLFEDHLEPLLRRR